jgi:lysophospholipase L1-like esterase
VFDDLPRGIKLAELWLPHDTGIDVRELAVNEGAICRPVPASGLKWVTYGSSLTHCRRAHGSARTWPGIVARRLGLDLTSLGYGGNCCLEPMVAMMIRDLRADLITLKLGINCIGGALAPRTFPAAVMGMVRIIREKQPETPICLISPIAYPPNETTPNVVGYTIQQMRADIEEVRARLVARGDRNLYYVSGLSVFNAEEIGEFAADQCHPNGDGIELMAENFLRSVMAKLPLPSSY